MNNPIYNFKKGQTAKYIKDKLGIDIGVFSTSIIREVENISYNEIEVLEGNAIWKDGEHHYFTFAFLQEYYTKKYNKLPKFHTTECSIIKKFSGFTFANKLPVKIKSRDDESFDENKERYLKMCKKCSKTHFNSFWGSPNKEWYDVVLEYGKKLQNPIMRKDGYISFWKQISTAYREKKGWTCEKCKIKLSNEEDKKFLHVHHKNGNKTDNRIENFESLCILCHAFEHLDKVKKREGFFELNEFIVSKKEILLDLNNRYVIEWENSTNDYIKLHS